MHKLLTSLIALTLIACGEPPGPGEITGQALPDEVVSQREIAQQSVIKQWPAATEKQILFGDLHVHTTYSLDAYQFTLPMMQNEGLHPIGDACDYARYCSDLDFWSINDHAISITPRIWAETKKSLQQCDAIAGQGSQSDLITFAGWEWTQIGRTPEKHYGHKNVVFKYLDDDKLPARVINSGAGKDDLFEGLVDEKSMLMDMLKWPLVDVPNTRDYLNYFTMLVDMTSVPACAEDINSPDLPVDCTETATTPDKLFAKLDQWGLDSIVIPHGNSWGLYTPLGATWDKQLAGKMHDPKYQTMIEVYSGHGNSEEHRPWRAIEWNDDGTAFCPEPQDGYEACCWRAGEIIQQRCDDPLAASCQQAISKARMNYLELGPAGHRSIDGESTEDWGNCGQCTDCFTPAFNHRPGTSAQYAMAITNFDEAEPKRFRFGFMASSDNHSARPGTGYKEYDRRQMTEASGPQDHLWRERIYNHNGKAGVESFGRDDIEVTQPHFNFFNWERGSSMFLTGGLIAVHSEDRSREQVWDALQRKEIYGTSGPKILLWFNLLKDSKGKTVAMGSEALVDSTPEFRVRAAGSQKQLPGCPDYAVDALGSARLEKLCHNECSNPSDERHPISRLEIVRITPQITPGEPVDELIEDPWRVIACSADGSGCEATFSDPEYAAMGREAIYYARAIQEATPAVNGAGLRCEYDESGQCIAVNPCYADVRTALDDDCLAPTEQRAWSSPIFVRPTG
ncbi:MAG: DUF3604 domain-containing protein [Pseudomonadales bacterium]